MRFQPQEDIEVTNARKARYTIGLSKAEFIKLRTQAIENAAQRAEARRRPWSPASRAAAMADVELAADEIYGKD